MGEPAESLGYEESPSAAPSRETPGRESTELRRTFRAEEPNLAAPELEETMIPTPARGASPETESTAVPPSPAAKAEETGGESLASPAPGPVDTSHEDSDAQESPVADSTQPSLVGGRYSHPAELPSEQAADFAEESVNLEELFAEPNTTPAAAPQQDESRAFPYDAPAGGASSSPSGFGSKEPANAFQKDSENESSLDELIGSSPGTSSEAVPPTKESSPVEASPVEEPTHKSFDELFGTSAKEDVPAQEKPAVEPEQDPADPEEPTEEQPRNELIEDLLGTRLEGQAQTIFAEERPWDLRVWHDKTEQFSCEARVLRYTNAGLLLERADGARIQLSFQDLSDADLAHVQRQVELTRAETARRRAAAQLAGSWAP